MEQNSDHTSKSTQSQPVVAEMDGILQQSKEPKSQKNKLSQTFTQHRVIIRDQFGGIGNNLIKNKNDNSQSLQQYESNQAEDTKAKIKAIKIWLKQLEQENLVYEKENQEQTQLIKQNENKITQLQTQISKLDSQFKDYQKQLEELEEMKEIHRIVSEKRRIKDQMCEIQGKRTLLNNEIKYLSVSISKTENKIEKLEAKMRKCQKKQNQLNEFLEGNYQFLYKSFK